MSLALFFRRLLRGWRVFAVCVAVSVIFGAALFGLIPSKWEAQGYIRLGQVAGEPIESSAAAMSRLTSYAILKTAMAGEAVDDNSLKAIRSDMQIQKIDDRVIFVKLRAEKREVALRRLQALCGELARQHKAISDDAVSGLSELLSDVNVGLKKYESINHQNGTDRVGATGASISRKIINLDEKHRGIKSLLRPPSTEDTRLQDNIYVTDQPVTPKLLLLVLTCVLLGLAIAFVYLFSGGCEVKYD